MKGKLTRSVLALMAALTLAAFASAGASAEGVYIFEATHTTIEGSQTGAAEFETSLGVVKCQKTTFSGTVETKEASEVTVTPAYSECKGPGELSATIDVNGCKFKFSKPTETGQSPPADMSAAGQIVKCTKAMEITASGCTTKIPEQTPETSTTDLTVKSTEPFKTLISPTFKGVSYTYSGIFCGTGSGGNGAYRGPVEAQGVVPNANPWFTILRVGGLAVEGANGVCEYAAAKQTCLIQAKENANNARVMRVLSTRILGVNAAARYKNINPGCIFNVGLGECTDEIEAVKFEAGGINDYCVTVEDKGNGAKSIYCRRLRM
jgi:hypothetical protein